MKASTSATPSTSAPPTHSAFPPPSTASLARSSRIAPHSHIKALGLTPEGLATSDGAGFIGQNNAREVRVSFLGFLAPTLTNMAL
jgi:RuvB-like protein 1 (pontin 52)